MSPKKLITALTLASALMVVAMPSTVSAQSMEQNQKLNQEIEVECTSGAYGQNTTCKAKGTQNGEQNQKISGYFKNGKFIAHKPVNTGLDSMTLTALFATVALGTTAAIAKYKTQA